MTWLWLARGFAVAMYIGAMVNGIAQHWEASALGMIACALFWHLGQKSE